LVAGWAAGAKRKCGERNIPDPLRLEGLREFVDYYHPGANRHKRKETWPAEKKIPKAAGADTAATN